jgi:hypothetical protein
MSVSKLRESLCKILLDPQLVPIFNDPDRQREFLEDLLLA